MKNGLLCRTVALLAAGVIALALSGCGADRSKGENVYSIPEFGSPSSRTDGAGENDTSSTASKNNASSQNDVPSKPDGDNDLMTDEEFEEFVKNNASSTGSIEVTIGNDKGDESDKPSSSSTPDKNTSSDKNGDVSSDSKTENSSSFSGNLWDKDGDGYYDITIY